MQIPVYCEQVIDQSDIFVGKLKGLLQAKVALLVAIEGGGGGGNETTLNIPYFNYFLRQISYLQDPSRSGIVSIILIEKMYLKKIFIQRIGFYQENNHRAKRSKYGNRKNTQVSGVQYKINIFWYVFVFFRYIPWNFHQMEENEFNFEGDRDFVSFINQAQDVGLFVILRAGPYICGEWDFVSINDKGTLLY